jgi:putative phosphoesterase
MLIAIVADTHLPRGARAIPSLCLERMRAADLIVHAGDLVSEEVLDELDALGPPVRAVHGNMDSAALRTRLPAELVLEADGKRIAVVHDAGPAQGRLERLRLRFPDADAAVFAHSHLPLHEVEGGFQIFNPGSPTERRRAPSHTMGVARAERGSLVFEHVVVG